EEGQAPEAVAELRQVVLQQRVWIDELQQGCDLLMKQLEFSQAIARSTDGQQVMTTALQLVLEIAHASRAEILWLEGKRLVPRLRKTSRGVKRMDEDWTYYADATDAVVRTGELIYLPDTRVEPGYEDLPDARAVLALPITDEYQRTGVILALGLPEGELVKRELDALKVLANQLSATLRNIRVQNEWRERNQRLEMLYMLSSSVTSTLVMAEVLDLVVKLSLEITQADRGFLFLLGDDGELTCEAARHPDGPIIELDKERYSQSICRRVLESGEALCVEDTLDDDVLKHQKSIQDLNLRTVMCVPLRVKQKYLGVLYVDSRVVVNTFTDRDLELLKSIASHASIALENARLYQLATVDGLTGLYFRSHFEQRMKEEIQRAQRFSAPLSFMMMDIDHFKKFNDTYGHGVGDQVLRHVAQIIKSNVRTDIDIPGRYGGEEMVVLLPETDAVGAGIFGERIRRAVDEALLSADGHEGLHVTISIGIASLPQHASTGLELMELADQALYASKHGGRNRVTVYTPAAES
ncbi:MAG TPA: diguanylate cyclase, partial [Oscillatoriaceae cyanobacterium]